SEDASLLGVPDWFTNLLGEMGDEKPMYVTQAVPMGYSRFLGPSESMLDDVKHRYWPESTLDSIITKAREGGLPGFRGHARDDGALRELPDPAILWIAGVKGTHKTTGAKAAILRGYVYDVNNNRNF